MVDLSWTGFVVWGINLLSLFLIRRIRGVGLITSAAISGWLAALIGMIILYPKKIFFLSFLSVTSALYFAVAVIIIILLVVSYGSSISNRQGILGNIGFAVTRTGWFIGGVVGFLCAVIK
jgi:peptidoglycan biosynthesis protein MviN/MurJ (putative lipid II flippase)